MRIVISVVICVILAMITSFFFPDFNPGGGVISTLYTISGIMFSIGMSLVITSNTSGVKNTYIRNGIRKELCRVRNLFIGYFAMTSLLFIFFYAGIDENKYILNYYLILKNSHLLIFATSYSIIFLVCNFLAIQRLHLQIEDVINQDSEDV